MELVAFFSERGKASAGDLRGALEICDDMAGAEYSDHIDEQIEEKIQEVFDYLQDRSKSAGGAYPFIVNDNGTEICLATGELSLIHYVYLFCLFVSIYRHDSLLPRAAYNGLENSVPKLFQACGTLAAAGFVSGYAISFDFPRPAGTGFIKALQDSYSRFGEGDPRDSVAAGMSPHEKDGGIDVIAWRPCPDGLPGQLYLLGQCASGKDWLRKSVKPAIDSFYEWFTRRPASPVVSAIFIPFSADGDLYPNRSRSYTEERKGRYLSLTGGLGVVFDRCRIPYYVERGLAVAKLNPSSVERVNDLGAIAEWVRSVRKQALGIPR